MKQQIALNVDCMEYMRTLPDKAFDLAVVDPPYGDGNGGSAKRFGGMFGAVYGENTRAHVADAHARERGGERYGAPQYNRFGGKFDKYKSSQNGRDMGGKVRKKIVAWDVAPKEEYFQELFRISRDQIIWGGNYFSLPPTRCFLILRKTNIPENFSMAMCEYAWTSFNGNAKVFDFNMQRQPGRFHPTQKPVELYEWILTSFAKEGDKILDTHLGSGSSRIAAYNLGFDFVGCEIDREYYEKQEERFAAHTAQVRMW